MYDPIFAKSFSRYERKRFGFFALILCFILALSICSTFKPHLHPLSLIGDAIKLQLSDDSAEDVVLAMNETNQNSEPTDDIAADDLEGNIATERVNNITTQHTDDTAAEVDDDSSAEASRNDPEVNLGQLNATSTQLTERSSPKTETTETPIKPLCRILESDADYCEIDGDVRIDPNSSTVFLVSPRPSFPESTWNVQPYPRRGIDYVKKWTVKTISDDGNITRIPQCTKNHSFPALLLSLGGYSGNLFHDFADLLHPLYSTSFQFHRQVHLLASDYKPWWASKYRAVLDGLTKHALIDIDRETTVHCFKKTIIGLNFYKELTNRPSSNASPMMRQFRQFLREAYSLERTKAIKLKKGRHHPRRGETRPRLMIISRRRTRIITNEDEVSSLAKKMGFEVVTAEADVSTDLTKFAQIVNSCDVLMGIHGAGLTNMVFLPDNAVLIQVVPLGGIDVFAKMDFGDPSSGMNVRYVKYGIELKESSLSRMYRSDDPVITDPLSFHRQGWLTLRSVYLDNQNVTIDLRRFGGALARAVKLLRR